MTQNAEYFVIECVCDDDDRALIPGLAPPPGEDSWRLGSRFKTAPVEPIVIELEPDYGILIPELDNVDSLLISTRLYEAFRSAGVHNLDAYRTVISHALRGFKSEDYLACNVIGLISAANNKRGKKTSKFDTDFDGFTLDPTKVKGQLLFRLAENTSAIVVHRTVREHLLANGFDQLMFVPPEEWIG